jgi:hypothetical protein
VQQKDEKEGKMSARRAREVKKKERTVRWRCGGVENQNKEREWVAGCGGAGLATLRALLKMAGA